MKPSDSPKTVPTPPMGRLEELGFRIDLDFPSLLRKVPTDTPDSTPPDDTAS